MKTSTTPPPKWIAVAASMSLAAGLGVAGFSYATQAANAEGATQTVPVTTKFSPGEFKGAEQKYNLDHNGNVTRIDLDMLNMHLREPQWNFLNSRNAQNGWTAEAFGRKFVYTTQETIYKAGAPIPSSCAGLYNAGFWAPVGPDGKIDHRWGAWGVAGKSTCSIGVGRLLYWDGAKWFNQSHFRVDWMSVGPNNQVTGYKVDAFREPSPSFDATVSGDYTAGWPSLQDDKDKQRLVSAGAYAFAHASQPEYSVFNKYVMLNAERRGDFILQLAFGTDLASSAEKVLVYKARYAEAVEKVKNMVGKGFVTPGEALKGNFNITKTSASTKDKTVYQVKLDKLGNDYYPVTEGKAEIKFVKDGKGTKDAKADAASASEKTKSTEASKTTKTASDTAKSAATESAKAAEKTEAASATAPKSEETKAEAAKAQESAPKAEAPAPIEVSLKDLYAGKTIEVPAGYKAVVDFKTGNVDTPGAYINRTSFNGTSMVAESGVSAHNEAHFELTGTEVVAPSATAQPTSDQNGPTAVPTETGTVDKDKGDKDKGDKDTTKPSTVDKNKGDKDKGDKDTTKPSNVGKDKNVDSGKTIVKPGATTTVTKTAAPANDAVAASNAEPAVHQPLAKTGATSLVALLVALALTVAGTGVVVARRFNS